MLYGAVTDAGRSGQKELAVALVSEFLAGTPNNFYRSSDTFGPEESVDWGTTKNLFIEGDNLEVLKLLQKSYANKVKVIYIDPPYNTGKEFIYPDNFSEGLNTYLYYTGQKTESDDWVGC